MPKTYAAAEKASRYEAICVVIAVLGFTGQCSRTLCTLRLSTQARLALTASITLHDITDYSEAVLQNISECSRPLYAPFLR